VLLGERDEKFDDPALFLRRARNCSQTMRGSSEVIADIL